MVGGLVYITITRPDIAYVVGVVSQFMQKPRTIHLDAAYRILRYLKGSPGKGLLFPSSSSLQMTGDGDADWARNPSLEINCIVIGDSSISWKSKKQQLESH